MTNSEWQVLVEAIAGSARAVTGEVFKLQFMTAPCLRTNCLGVVGGAGGFQNIVGAANSDTESRRITMGLFDRGQATAVDVPVAGKDGVDSLRLKTFEELAAFLLLHELGHIVRRHHDDNREAEAAANEFAEQHLTAVLSHHGEGLSTLSIGP